MLVRRGTKEDFLISSAHAVSDVRGRGSNLVCTADPQTGTALSVIGSCKESRLQIGGVNQIDAALVELDQDDNFPAGGNGKAGDIVVDRNTPSKVQKVGFAIEAVENTRITRREVEHDCSNPDGGSC